MPITDHRTRAKRRLLGIMNAKGETTRKEELYMDLLKVTRKTVDYAIRAVPLLKEYRCGSVSQIILAEGLAHGLSHYVGLSEKVIDQTERRVANGESLFRLLWFGLGPLICSLPGSILEAFSPVTTMGLPNSRTAQ
jgi:hypothetical protein